MTRVQSWGCAKERWRRRAEKWSSRRVFWRVRFFSAPLRFSSVLRANLKGAEKRWTLQKHPFGQPVSPHDAFAAPFPRSEKYRCIPKGEETRRDRSWSVPEVFPPSNKNNSSKGTGCGAPTFRGISPNLLVARPKYPPLSRDRCSNTPVALCFLWCRRLSLLHPHESFLKNGLWQSKTDRTRGVSQTKLASEAYRAIGGIAWNSIANRAIVGH